MVKNTYKLLKYVCLTITIIIIVLTLFIFKNDSNTIVIGTKNFTEQRIVAQIIKDYIEIKTDYNVVIKSGLGETSFLNEALTDQDIDLYVDYSSNGYLGILGQEYNGETSEEINNYLNAEYNEKFNSSWISFLGFENTNALICKQFCINNDVTEISDLSNYDFTMASPPNFYVRSDGWNLIEDGYNISISENNKLKMDSVLIYQAVSHGDVDVGLAFTTDGRLQTDDYIMLTDKEGVFPKYDAGIVVNNNSLIEYNGLESLLKDFNNSITTAQMSELNYQVDIEGQSIESVASEFITRKIED